jgi:Flp pilus assembly protein TadG
MMPRNLDLHDRRQSGRDGERGQMLVLFAVFLVVLVLFMGLGIDLGFAYVTKAQLSKAVDAAALAGMSNFYQGSAIASNIAAGAFAANFAPGGTKPGYIKTMPVPSINFSTDSASNQTLTVSATATINTFFIGVLPWWKTMNVADTGKATRARVIMTLVLDHSGSMDPITGSSRGGANLPSAVANFINVFEDNIDSAAVVTFGSSVTNDVPMTTPFIAKVTSAVNNIDWDGGTFAHGGLTNALQINNAVLVPTNVNAIKVVVFFTDGEPNMIQTVTSCPNPLAPAQRWNFGGYDPTQTPYPGVWQTNAPSTADGQNYPYCQLPCGTCANFTSIDGSSHPYTMLNVIGESTNRCIQVANQMRAAGMYVYCIGLYVGGVGTADADFLRQVANDKDSPTRNRSLPEGLALTTGNGTDLTPLFQQVAGDILLRLTY